MMQDFKIRKNQRISLYCLIFMILAFHLQSCITEQESVKQTCVPWSKSARKPYLNEWIIVKFKSENRRSGVLREEGSGPCEIFIDESGDRGIYNLNEVLTIYDDTEKEAVIYP